MNATHAPSDDILTAEQTAAYLQVSVDTVYRYIREGKLLASRLGRAYRISRPSIDLLLWSSPARPDIVLRDYHAEQIAEFLAEDELDAETLAVTRRYGWPKPR